MPSCDKAYNATKQIHTQGHVTVTFLYLNAVSDLSAYIKRRINECSVLLGEPSRNVLWEALEN